MDWANPRLILVALTFDCAVAIYPDFNLDDRFFPQYVEPRLDRGDDTRKISVIEQFKKNGFSWNAPNEPGTLSHLSFRRVSIPQSSSVQRYHSCHR
jgi:hypothetical protein